MKTDLTFMHRVILDLINVRPFANINKICQAHDIPYPSLHRIINELLEKQYLIKVDGIIKVNDNKTYKKVFSSNREPIIEPIIKETIEEPIIDKIWSFMTSIFG